MFDKKQAIESSSDVKTTSPRILELMKKISYLENAQFIPKAEE